MYSPPDSAAQWPPENPPEKPKRSSENPGLFDPPFDAKGGRPAPRAHKRNVLIRRLARAPWWFLIAAALIVIIVMNVAQDEVYQRVFAEVRQGIGTTIGVTLVAFSAAILLGLLIAILRRSSNPVVYQLVTLYVEVVRGVPTLVLVYYIVLAVTPGLIELLNQVGAQMVAAGGWGSVGETLSALRSRDVDSAARAIVALAISYSAFLSEIFRAGIDSIAHGQREAGMSLGLTHGQVMWHIILPQAFRNVLPPLANDFIAMLKESSLVSVVGVAEITRQGNTFAAANFVFFQSYNVIALTYLVLTLTLSIGVKALEWLLDRGKVRGV